MELSIRKRNLIFAGCLFLTASIQLSAMGLNNTMYAILQSKNGVQFYALVSLLSGFGTAIMTPVGGKLGDLFGRRKIAFAGAGLSVLCMLGMGLTQSLFLFIFLRALLSFGIGIFTSIPLAVCADIYSEEVYTAKVAVNAAVQNGSVFVGSALAGALTDRGMTELSIIYPGIICFLGAVLICVNLPESTVREKPVIDYAGMGLFTVFSIAVSLTFHYVGPYGMSHPLTLTGVAVTMVSALILYKVESKSEQPVIPFYLFRNKKYLGVSMIMLLVSAPQVALGVYLPVTGQEIMGLSAATTGMFTLPRTLLCLFFPLFTAVWVEKKRGRACKAQVLAGIATVITFGGMLLTDEKTPVWLPFMLFAVMGIGDGFSAVASTPVAVKQLPEQDKGVGIGLLSTMGSLGATLMMAMMGTIYSAKSDTDLNGALHGIYLAAVICAVITTALALVFLREKKTGSRNEVI